MNQEGMARRSAVAPFSITAGAAVVVLLWASAGGDARAQSWALPGANGPGTQAAPSWAQPVISPNFGQQGAPATGWFVQPTLRLQETYTTNVALAPKGAEKRDAVTELTPGLLIRGVTQRVQVYGNLGATGLWYWNEDQYNRIVPGGGIRGRLEAVERLAFLEASAQAGPQFANLLGTQPTSLSTGTTNRYTQYIYTVSPYIQRRFEGGSSILLRNDNVWSQATGNTSIRDSYTQQWTGALDYALGRAWFAGASYNYNSIEYQGSPALTNDISRGRLTWRPDPTIQLYGTGGYETNNYFAGDRSGSTYGGGARWLPTDRTTLIADWEHRFFGSTYFYSASHRMRSAVLDVRSTRGLSSYPQLVAGGNTVNFAAQLDTALSGSIADPAARQAAVDQLLVQLGLPATGTVNSAFYTQTVFIQQRNEGGVTLVGVRNTLGFSLFHSRSEAIPTAVNGISAQATFDTRQRGGTITWNSKLSANLSLNAIATRYIAEVVGGGLGVVPDESTNTTYRLVLSTPLSPRMDAFAGGRHYRFDSSVQTATRENAVFAGLGLRF